MGTRLGTRLGTRKYPCPITIAVYGDINYSYDSTKLEFQALLLRLTTSLVTLLNKGFGAFLCL